jgi:hypothetical protein
LNPLAFPVLLYGSECCTAKAEYRIRIVVAEMMYKRRKEKYMQMDHERNKGTLNKLKTVLMLNKISK